MFLIIYLKNDEPSTKKSIAMMTESTTMKFTKEHIIYSKTSCSYNLLLSYIFQIYFDNVEFRSNELKRVSANKITI
jgi:hypothetical protein